MPRFCRFFVTYKIEDDEEEEKVNQFYFHGVGTKNGRGGNLLGRELMGF